jgi:GTP-binding protein
MAARDAASHSRHNPWWQVRPDYVINKTFDLFCDLGASDEQTEFDVVYTSALNRIAGLSPDSLAPNMSPLLDKILELPRPIANTQHPLQLQISNVDMDTYIGRLGVGRVRSGQLAKGSPIGLVSSAG